MADILVVYKKNFEAVHDASLDLVTQALETSSKNRGGLRIDVRAREQVRRADFIGRDLVIVLGGDGTLTSISHNIDAATPVMGVNSHPRAGDPTGSFGFYMDSNIDTFAEDLETAQMENLLSTNYPAYKRLSIRHLEINSRPIRR